MKIGIVGARVAGSYAGLLLAGLGHDVILFDDSVEREKPCGGGLTAKALRNIRWIREQALSHAEIAKVRLVTHEGYSADLPLLHPMHVFPRITLDAFLRMQAIGAGVQFRCERVVKIVGEKGGWFIKTASSGEEVQYLIGADGANSVVRRAMTDPHPPADLVLTLGYVLPGVMTPDMALIHFQESGFLGYLWAFPCVDHSSVGIGRMLPGAQAADLRRRLDVFVDHYPSWASAEKKFYAALVPCLGRKSLIEQRVCGKNWALLGDAAGFADAVTAEGIYYALRSAELLAESFQKESPLLYEHAWRKDFGFNLETAAVWRDRFYGSRVLAETFIRRALQTVRYSGTVRSLLDKLIAGKITYSSLFRNLAFRSPSILLQCYRNRAASTLNVQR
jgi:flavin-dependent dehydrogenase